MKRRRVWQRTWLAALTLLLAVVLSLVLVPERVAEWRPPWVALTLIFWCFAMPERIGILTAFLLGLLLDTVTGTPLGQHALALSVVAYLAVVLRPRLRIFPIWQQSLFVWVLLLVERLLTLWVMGATGQPLPPLSYWNSTLVGLALWPLLALALRPLERRVESR